ncbi:S-adenosyl-L-methionine-dependent tRNA 4-demethylwyosine synthase [Sarcoptes scabiei]|nr:S-adenosyl-L-methionine-dependent tRNA 4-demethylwyosine synthase [Sarcoptes scabiei]
MHKDSRVFFSSDQKQTSNSDRNDSEKRRKKFKNSIFNLSTNIEINPILKMFNNLLGFCRKIFRQNKTIPLLVLASAICWKLIQRFKLREFFLDKLRSQYRLKDKFRRNSKLKIIYASNSGVTKSLALKLYDAIKEKISTEETMDQFQSIELLHADQYDPEDELINDARLKTLLIILMPTYSQGEPPEEAEWFCKYISESSEDFRFPKNALIKLRFIILGVGDSNYGDDFCKCAFNLERCLKNLQANCLIPMTGIDVSSNESIEDQFSRWFDNLSLIFQQSDRTVPPSRNSRSSISPEYSCSEKTDSSDFEELCSPPDQIVDLEDLVEPIKVRSKDGESKSSTLINDMITPKIRKELSKQGYKLVGTHSGVKLCRWTKSMLRGRGCYKHTFYGIESHRCMEATPSLACANKCVFCWRHHSNPVGTKWQWNLDDPEMIFNDLQKQHYSMINEFKGVPGVLPERIDSARTIRHCALSLVGEPIMYPKINELIRLLHSRSISTFLVTNAQFPDAIKNLEPVTQLYVSVDASSKISLKKIDRPLFHDFWERFLDSLRYLSLKNQRTVYRLTLVKSWNSDEIDGYAELVMIGRPEFIEIKGVTFCGDSSDSKLTIKNSPRHCEVVGFSQSLTIKINHLIRQNIIKHKGNEGFNSPDIENEFYAIASEHEHSNCVLLAKKKFYISGFWYTWIDYDRFDSLIKEYYESKGKKTFSSKDYCAQTPRWANFGAKEQGFDPEQTKVKKERRHYNQTM